MKTRLKIVDLGGKSLPFFYEEARPLDFFSVSRQTKGRKFDPNLVLGTASRCRLGCPRVILCAPLKIQTQGDGVRLMKKLSNRHDPLCSPVACLSTKSGFTASPEAPNANPYPLEIERKGFERLFTPFPTSFWLTCPWLVRMAGTAESKGGVRELERWIERYAYREWIAFNMDHQRTRIALLPRSMSGFLRRFEPSTLDLLYRGGVGGIQYRSRGEPARVKCIHLQVASWLALRRHPGRPWLEDQGLGQDCDGRLVEICKGR
ncbi:MAG: DUF501 domain-containing protein [Synergistaceae bacterium]|jgi:hypothetical protein|nr:DUF501 domain-containing protein [Synergistaceae bacterium]